MSHVEGGPAGSQRPGHPRILVLRRRYLGDTVLTEPLLRNLRHHWPGSWLAIAVDTPYVDTLAACPDIDEIVEVPAGKLGVRTAMARWAASMLSVVRRAPWDVVFDLARNERALALLLASRARRRVTLAVDGRLSRERLYTDVVHLTRHEADASHIVDTHNRLLRAVGVPATFRVPAVPVRESDKVAAAAALRRASVTTGDGRRLVLVHPGSGSDARRWPPTYFARVADQLVEHARATVVVLSGPAEPGLARAVLEEMTKPAVLLADPPSVPILYGLISQADLLLCNDSGPMHMAAAVSTPVCALFGSQSATTWAPLGDAGHLTFQPSLPCGSACVAPDACHPDDPMKSFCVRRVRPDEVADKLLEHLAGTARGDGASTAASG